MRTFSKTKLIKIKINFEDATFPFANENNLDLHFLFLKKKGEIFIKYSFPQQLIIGASF
jgi:hypothetical protein